MHALHATYLSSIVQSLLFGQLCPSSAEALFVLAFHRPGKFSPNYTEIHHSAIVMVEMPDFDSTPFTNSGRGTDGQRRIELRQQTIEKSVQQLVDYPRTGMRGP